MSEYIIKKGNHYASGLHFGVHFGITEQKYRVRFSKECLYQPIDWENDYNKLCGWSYGMHHNNSIRVCWRPYVSGVDTLLNQIELCIYVYENGIRKVSEDTIVVNVEQDYDLSLSYDNNGTVLSVYSDSKLLDRIIDYYNLKPTWGYRLYPYIGGQNVASVDTKIELERL